MLSIQYGGEKWLTAAIGASVASIAEEMNECVRNPELFNRFDQREEMVDVRVNAAIADQSKQVKTAVVLFCILSRRDQSRILHQFVLFYRQIDSHNVLQRIKLNI